MGVRGVRGETVASSEHILLKWYVFNNFNVICFHEDGQRC